MQVEQNGKRNIVNILIFKWITMEIKIKSNFKVQLLNFYFLSKKWNTIESETHQNLVLFN